MHPRQFYERVIRAFSFSGEGEVYQPVVTVSLVARVVNHGYSRRLHILARSLIPPAYPPLHPGHDAALVLGFAVIQVSWRKPEEKSTFRSRTETRIRMFLL